MVSSRLKIAAIVVTYNRRDRLENTIKGLKEQSFPLDKIIVVDNNSADGTSAYLAGSVGDDVEVISLSENVGGAGGFSVGMEHAYRGPYDLIWVMDDDVECDPHALEELVKAYLALVADHCPPSVLVSRVVSEEGEPMNVPQLDLRSGENGYPIWPGRVEQGLLPITQATFVSALFPRATLSRHGLPFAEMFIWADDIEYTHRVTRSAPGFMVLKSVVRHVGRGGRASIVQVPDSKVSLFYYYYRNNLFVARRRGWKHVVRFLRHSARDLRGLVRARYWQRGRVLIEGLLAGVLFNPRARRLDRLDEERPEAE